MGVVSLMPDSASRLNIKMGRGATSTPTLKLFASQVDQQPLNLVSLARSVLIFSTKISITNVLKVSQKKLAQALGARVLIVAFVHYRKAAKL
jgi:hypothetical protein